MRLAFTTLGLHRLEANIQPNNERSKKLVEACGFQCEGLSEGFCSSRPMATTNAGCLRRPRYVTPMSQQHNPNEMLTIAILAGGIRQKRRFSQSAADRAGVS